MTPRARFVLLAILLLGAGALAWRVAISLERVEEDIVSPPGLEARRRPLLAASRYLVRQGIPANPSERLDQPPPPGHVLLLADPAADLPGGLVEELAAWVRGGGHLIAAPCQGLVFEDEEPVAGWDLLEELGLEVRCFEDEEVSEQIKVLFTDPDESLNVDSPWIGVTDKAEGEGFRVVVASSLTRGGGRITLLGDAGVFVNDRIRSLDHARLLERLVTLHGPPAGVWLVHDVGTPDLAGLLWRHGWRALTAAGLALGLFLWRAGARFGPGLPSPAAGSRSLLDHIDAVGALLWRLRPEALLVAARQAMLRRAAARRPQLMRLPAADRLEALAGLAGERAPLARRALEGSGAAGAEEFTRWVSTLETIRRAL
ncbi:MAG: DUF4350 domain-containing protein [Candidatus Polarisedimenticolia bacterium]